MNHVQYMEEIDELDFLELLSSKETTEHKNLLVNFDEPTNVDLRNVTLSNKFTNCIFRGKRLDFIDFDLDKKSDSYHIFSFDNCEFENDVFFKDCFLGAIRFSNISKPIKNLYLSNVTVEYLSFQSQKEVEQKTINDTNIFIRNCDVLNSLDFLHFKSSSYLLITDCNIDHVKFHNCKFERVDIDYNIFSSDFQFTQNNVKNSYIKYNQFEKSNFSNTNFGLSAVFRNNDFKSTALFENLLNKNETRINFESCNFFKYAHFNKSEIYELHIDTSKFQEFASFQDLKLNLIFLDRTIFEKLAFFDDMEIIRFDKCKKRTLRNIKQQLLRADNKIDYDTFRVHELNAYKEELKIKLNEVSTVKRKKTMRDLTILRINSFFSNNGTDWLKALKRTLFGAIFIYSIFYVIHNLTRTDEIIHSSRIHEYFVGLFRYFMLTDFHNPLLNSKEYLDTIWEWIPFTIGKVFIAIGIYEMVVSFRKFKK